MLSLEFSASKNSPFCILCLGAHCDDIEIGCGGTILKLIDSLRHVTILWVILSSDQYRAKEARKSASKFLQGAQQATVEIKDFRNGFFPYNGKDLKEYFEKLKGEIKPDLIFTHYRHDLHQDHRVVSELTWNTFRDHLILEYEIPKYDGDLGSPNFFVTIPREICLDKIKIITNSFKSQKEKQWFTKDLFLSIMRIRGMECNSQFTFAEGFYCRKTCLQF